MRVHAEAVLPGLPAPYYQHAGITIYHADCAEVLPLLPKCDVVLTDPPYGGVLTKSSGHGKLKEAAARYGGGSWDVRPHADTLRLVLSGGGSAIVWGGNYFSSDLPDARCWLVWDKANGSSSFADAELAWTNLDQAVRMVRCSVSGMPGRAHPTQKPLAVMSWALSHVPDAKSVLDPFMGSGTTLRAAKDRGLTAVGIEREERYCEIAARRLAQGVLF